MKTAVILTTQRTGSTFLSYWLNNHPFADFYNEVFLKNSPAHDAFRHYYVTQLGNETFYMLLTNRVFYRSGMNLIPKRYTYEYLDSLVDSPKHSAPFPKLGEGRQHHEKSTNTKLVGFKLMYDQLRFFSSLKHWIVSNHTAVIHLLRRNMLMNFISKERLRQFGVGHSYSDVQTRPIQFDYRRFASYAHDIERKKEFHKTMFLKTNSYLELYYEDIFADLEKARDTIFSFLELEVIHIPTPELKKIASSSLEKEVTNHEETRKAIRSSKFAYLLEDF